MGLAPIPGTASRGGSPHRTCADFGRDAKGRTFCKPPPPGRACWRGGTPAVRAGISARDVGAGMRARARMDRRATHLALLELFVHLIDARLFLLVHLHLDVGHGSCVDREWHGESKTEVKQATRRRPGERDRHPRSTPRPHATTDIPPCSPALSAGPRARRRSLAAAPRSRQFFERKRAPAPSAPQHAAGHSRWQTWNASRASPPMRMHACRRAPHAGPPPPRPRCTHPRQRHTTPGVLTRLSAQLEQTTLKGSFTHRSFVLEWSFLSTKFSGTKGRIWKLAFFSYKK